MNIKILTKTKRTCVSIHDSPAQRCLTMCVTRLLCKFKCCAGQANTNKWTPSFLPSYTFWISDIGQVTPGVFQGTMLRPILMLVFINDIPNQVKQCMVWLFEPISYINHLLQNIYTIFISSDLLPY